MIEYIIIAVAFSVATFFTMYLKALKEVVKDISVITYIGSFTGWVSLVSVIFPLMALLYLCVGHDNYYDAILDGVKRNRK